MTGTRWTRLVAELKAYGEALAALEDDAAAIDHARLRRIEDELAVLKARVAARPPEPPSTLNAFATSRLLRDHQEGSTKGGRPRPRISPSAWRRDRKSIA